MKKKRLIRSLLCGMVLLGSIGGFITTAYADSVGFEFTLSNVAGVESGNSYTRLAKKTNTKQYFEVTLSMMTNSTASYYIAYNSLDEAVSSSLMIRSTQLTSTKQQNYRVSALEGASYYTYVYAPRGYANVYVKGTFCP